MLAHRRPRIDRKTAQLCHQVGRAVQGALSAELGHELFSHLLVLEVVPAPNASQLLVTLQIDAEPGTYQLDQVHQLLSTAAGSIRFEVATAITRRRAPRLAFQIVPAHR